MRDPFAAQMRSALAPLLPPGAFLKRDRGESLFVTDAPRRGASPDWRAAGYTADVADGLAYLTPDARWLCALEELYPEPPDDLCAALRRFDGPPDAEALRLFALGMKLLDGAPYAPAFDRRLRQLAAVALREHSARGGLYACGLVRYRIVKERIP